MNQILVMGNKNGKNGKAVDIKKVIIFFSIAIIIFGGIMLAQGSLGIFNKKNNDNTPPVASSQTPTPVPTPEEDKQNPTMDISLAGGIIKVTARDETELDYLSYKWNDEEEVRVEVTNDKNKIETNIEILQGSNNLHIVVADKAGNIEEKTQTFKGTIRPEVRLLVNETGDKVIIEAECADGLEKIEFTQNGERYGLEFIYEQAQYEAQGIEVQYGTNGKVSSVKFTHPLVEGENRFTVYAYSIEGEKGEKSGRCEYNPNP